MTVVHTIQQGYLESEYLNNQYLLNPRQGQIGLQFEGVISKQVPVGIETENQIIDKESSYGIEYEGEIYDIKTSLGIQYDGLVNELSYLGIEYEGEIHNKENPLGVQYEGLISKKSSHGIEYEGEIYDRKIPYGIEYEGEIAKQSPYGLQVEGDLYIPKQIGLQYEGMIVDKEKSLGLQFESYIIDRLKSIGLEYVSTINDLKNLCGLQSQTTIKALKSIGIEYEVNITINNSRGIQYEGTILTLPNARGLEYRDTSLLHLWQGVYLSYAGYLTDAYLAGRMHAITGLQVEQDITKDESLGLQYEGFISKDHPIGIEYESEIFKETSYGLQYEGNLNKESSHGLQFESNIIDRCLSFGFQVEVIILKLSALGIQFDSITLKPYGIQTRFVIYNHDNLRILCDYASRGITGENWIANSTGAGDFSANNLNTDIVEQVWRSATGVKSGVILDCDTEITQVFVDTFAMLNHNLTTSAIVKLIGSNNPIHTPSGVIHNIQVTEDNAYWIAEDLPLTGYRYWRITIDDNTNIDDFISIGTILFGDCQLLSGECFVDELEFKYNDFSDKVLTQGHTNVSNSLALKRYVRLDFRMLRSEGGNFELMRQIFKRYRTTHKCLWIPTPSPYEQVITDRYAVYGKLVDIPQESHKSLGVDKDYASFTIEVDESK